MICGVYVASELGDDLIKMDLSVEKLRKIWERTATELEQHQANTECVDQEHDWIIGSHTPNADRLPMGCWNVHDWTQVYREPSSPPKHCVAVVRGEGTNGHREMAAMLYCAGFTVHDITSSDLTDGRVGSLSIFRGLVFPGGFTYSDVLGELSQIQRRF